MIYHDPQFEEFLREKFMAQYTGIKDNAEEAEDNWLADLNADELQAYADEFNAPNK